MKKDIIAIIEPIIQKIQILIKDDEMIRQWFHTPNPFFGDITPSKMIHNGKHKRVLQFIESAIEENGL